MGNTFWLAYARSGKEIEVQAALHDLGIDAYCAKVVEAKRVGKRRKPDVFIEPLLPNYLFLDCSASQYLEAVGVKHMAPTMSVIPDGDWASVTRFVDRADDEFNTRMAKIAAGEKLEQFRHGDVLDVLDGPLRGLIATFTGIVEHDLFPSIKADVEMMGRTVKAEFDILDVRAAE